MPTGRCGLAGVEDVLNGQLIDEATIAKAEAAASAAVDPQDDIHASAAYRRALVGTMVERALKTRRRACPVMCEVANDLGALPLPLVGRGLGEGVEL